MTKNTKRKSWIFILIILISTSVVFLINKGNSTNAAPAEEVKTDNPIDNYNIFSMEIPAEMEFAGEIVPLGQLDIRESLDREILVNTYWHSQTILFIKKANRYFPIIEKILKKYNIPDDFKYLPVAESGLSNAVSPAQAVGFWQLLAGTARDYGLEVNKEVDERYHLEKSTEVACKYLLESYEKYGSWTMAAASYNIGRRGIDRQILRQKEGDYYDLLLPEETARYVFRILAFKLILSNPSDYGFVMKKEDLYPPIATYEVTIDGPVNDFAEFASRYGMTYKVLKIFNPWLRDINLINRYKKTYYIKIPRHGYFDPARVDNQHPEFKNKKH